MSTGMREASPAGAFSVLHLCHTGGIPTVHSFTRCGAGDNTSLPPLSLFTVVIPIMSFTGSEAGGDRGSLEPSSCACKVTSYPFRTEKGKAGEIYRRLFTTALFFFDGRLKARCWVAEQLSVTELALQLRQPAWIEVPAMSCKESFESHST